MSDAGRARPLIVRHLGRRAYLPTWQAMRDFTDARAEHTPSELWVVEHPAVFTQGQAGRAEHLIAPGDIPVIQTDRGGQVTYHGPGQLVIYLLLSLREAGIGIRGLVNLMENTIIDLLAAHGVAAEARAAAALLHPNIITLFDFGYSKTAEEIQQLLDEAGNNQFVS